MTEEILGFCPCCGRVVSSEDVERFDGLCPKCKTDWWLHPLKHEESEGKTKKKFGVWCNPARIGKRGDDYYYRFATLKEAKGFIRTHKEANLVPFKIKEEKK